MHDPAATDTALDALERARRAWEKRQDQQQLDLNPDGLDETHHDTTPSSSPHRGRVRLVEPAQGSGASPTPAPNASRALPSPGSSFRQNTSELGGRGVPGPRHLHVAPDPKVPTPLPLPRLLEVLS